MNKITMTLGTLTAAFFILMAPGAANAVYKNKLSVQRITNPQQWEGALDPGSLAADSIRRFLLADGKFQIVSTPPAMKKPGILVPRKNPEARSDKMKASQQSPTKSKDKNASASPRDYGGLQHPAQFNVTGKIMVFEMDKPPTATQLLLNPDGIIEQRVRMLVKIDLIAHHTDRSVANKIFRVEARTGSVPLDASNPPTHIDAPELLNSSLGRALKTLSGEVVAFVNARLYSLPLDGEAVMVDVEKREMLINLGWLNGVRMGDQFDIYAVTLKFTPPFSQEDLGDKYARRGVIVVKEVRKHYSLAEIVAGKEIREGDLARSRKSNSPLIEQAPSKGAFNPFG